MVVLHSTARLEYEAGLIIALFAFLRENRDKCGRQPPGAGAADCICRGTSNGGDAVVWATMGYGQSPNRSPKGASGAVGGTHRRK